MLKLWVLLFIAYPYGGGPPAMVSAEFNSKKACDEAGEEAVAHFSYTWIMTARYICKPKGE